MNTDHYSYRVTWSADDNEHLGLCTEFPSLSWLAETPEVALAGIRSLVQDVLEDMQKKSRANTLNESTVDSFGYG